MPCLRQPTRRRRPTNQPITKPRAAHSAITTINDTSTNLLQQGLDKAEVQDLSQSITNLNNLQTQLQATYQVTAQLKGLSLANFLPA